MQKLAVILLSFLSAVTVLAQNDALESINTDVKETIIEPQYDFVPDENNPDVEVAPLAINAQDQDVPMPPEIKENVDINVISKDTDLGNKL